MRSVFSRPLVALALAVAACYGGYRAVQSIRFEVHFSKAGEALEREAFEEAGRHLGRCVAIDPDSSRAHFRAAQAARRSGELDLAGEELQNAEDLGWPEESVRLERRLAAAQRGDLDAATEEYLLAHRGPESPDRVSVLEALVQGYSRGYRLGAAHECADTWIEARPDSVNAHMKRGWIRERLGRMEDAAADYRFAADRQPHYRPARLKLGQALIHLAKFAEAAAVFDWLVAESEEPDAILGWAQARAGLGQSAEAKARLLELNAKKQANAVAFLELGKLAMIEGNPAEAREWFDKAVARSPEEHEPHYQLSLALRQLGDVAGAEKAAAKFRQIEADLKSMATLTASLQAQPNDADLRVRIAEIFFRRGETAEGARWLEQALAADPHHAGARARLADHYERGGRPDRARRLRRAN